MGNTIVSLFRLREAQNLESQLYHPHDKFIKSKKEENMTETENKNLPTAPNKLVITGKGRIIEGADYQTSRYNAAVTSDLKVLLGGKDVTDKIKRASEDRWPAFISNSICDELYQPDFYLSEDDLNLPPSVFTLPENFEIDKIELIKVYRDFEDFYENGIWVDYIIYDNKVLEADTLWDDYYGEDDFENNYREYEEIGCDGDETKIFRW